jgi:hypothetical protein
VQQRSRGHLGRALRGRWRSAGRIRTSRERTKDNATSLRPSTLLGELPWEWRIIVRRSPLLAELIRDPDIEAALAELEGDFAAQAGRYRGLVADGGITVP